MLIACGVRRARYQDSVDDIAVILGSVLLGKRKFAQSFQRGKNAADDIVGGCVYFGDWVCVFGGEAGGGGLEEVAELGAVEAAGGVYFGDGDVGVEDCDVHFSLLNLCFKDELSRERLRIKTGKI